MSNACINSGIPAMSQRLLILDGTRLLLSHPITGFAPILLHVYGSPQEAANAKTAIEIQLNTWLDEAASVGANNLNQMFGVVRHIPVQ